jgi:2-polyprenyl-6-methoxyphenol hydroxylase-like FAD-dependent oxidoreductase
LDLRVVIVGAGLAGLACAVAASRAGATVELFEAGAAVHAPMAHVDVVPNLLRDLVCLGVGDDCVRAGFAYRRTVCIDFAGRTVFGMDASRLAGDRYPASVGITHAALTTTLATAALRLGARLHLGHRVHRVSHRAGRIDLTVNDQERAAADLLVLATGSHGTVPEGISVKAATPQGAEHEWTYLLASRPWGLDDAVLAASRSGHKAHLVPLAEGRAGIRISAGTAGGRLDTPSAVRKALASFPPPLAVLAERIRDDQPFAVRRVAEGIRSVCPSDVPVVAVGEFAHALAPQFGQSASQAVEDAVVLGDLLSDASDATSLAQGFTQRRSPRVQRVFEITSQAARWESAPGPETDFPALARSLADAVRRPA